MIVRNEKCGERGFSLVEVLIVSVIVAVLAIIGVQLYQGYVREARVNTADSLAASATSFLQTVANVLGESTADLLADGLDGTTAVNRWTVTLAAGNVVTFTCPANAQIDKADVTGFVSAAVGPVGSRQTSGGTYSYK